MISTYYFETFCTYNPHFQPKNIPFVLLTHVECVVSLTRTPDRPTLAISTEKE